jgi:hypothetical protein
VRFDLLRFLRRSRDETSASSPEETARRRGIPFVGFTDEWRLEGSMDIEGRAWDVLNRRQPIPITGVHWGPLDGSTPMEPAPGLRRMDSYDLVVALAVPVPEASGPDILRGANIPVDVVLHCPPLRVVGTVRMRPGQEAEELLLNQPDMFIPIGGAVAFLDRQPLSIPPADLVLVNRAYLKDVRPIDARTLEAIRPLARAAPEQTG